MVTDEMVEKAARAMCEAWHYSKIGTPDGDAEWRKKQDQYRKQSRAALEAALSAAEPEKPAAEEYRHPEWIWYCESTTGPMVTFGRWAKNPQQKRYKLADIQPTEHDHPAPSVAVKALEWHKQAISHGYGLFIRLARTSIGDYQISNGAAGKYEVYFNKGPISAAYDSEPEAKAAAQSDYEARIRSALSAQVQAVEVDRSTDIRKAGLKARDELLECMFDASTVDNDLAEYMERIIDACVRAATPAKQEG